MATPRGTLVSLNSVFIEGNPNITFRFQDNADVFQMLVIEPEGSNYRWCYMKYKGGTSYSVLVDGSAVDYVFIIYETDLTV